MSTRSKKLLLFDVDGTLTLPRKVVESKMEMFMEKVRGMATIGLVGGSDLPKIAEQMKGMEVLEKYDYVFSENGLVGHKGGVLIHKQDISKHIGDEKLQKLINFSLRYMSEIELPVKRGTFIEFRSGLINICPVGRSCSQVERDQFAEYDAQHGIRNKFRDALVKEFSSLGLRFVIGGQISMDAFPDGWDKTYCLQFVEKDSYDVIHFFGDKTSAGGNDHEIFLDSRVVGHTVTSPDDTMKQVAELLNIQL
jgi:phosphomannomutase